MRNVRTMTWTLEQKREACLRAPMGNFGGRLARRGFSSGDVRGMGCDTSLACAAPQRITVDEASQGNLEAYVATEQQGWSLPAGGAVAQRGVYMTAMRARPRRVHLFVARLEEKLVGTAGLVLRDGYAYLLAAQVLAEARGQGVYRALVTARLNFLRQCGIGYAVTQAREATSAPMLEHLSFETLFRSKCYLLR